jgi:transposase
MGNNTEQTARRSAIHMLRSGKKPKEVAKELGYSLSWVYKWWNRYKQKKWAGLQDRSRRPKRSPTRLPGKVRKAIQESRSELEAEATKPGNLTYIGAHAVQARLRQKSVHPLPSISSIERELSHAGMTYPNASSTQEKTVYPKLSPKYPGQLVQLDIVPHYLPGGQCISCFNAIDVVSRYPTGQQYERKRSQEASDFLVHIYHQIGIPVYTQMDNESCFSGGFTHPHVLGKVVRLALYVGTEVVFSPFYHPKSNGHIERFHQDYDRHVWEVHELERLSMVQHHSKEFFNAYRISEHHSVLDGYSPYLCHQRANIHKLNADFQLPDPRPVTVGKLHFIRKVNEQGCVRILNVDWPVNASGPGDGVWATLSLVPNNVKLRVYDDAPDRYPRRCLAIHSFPVKGPIMPLQAKFSRGNGKRKSSLWQKTPRSIAGWFKMF